MLKIRALAVALIPLLLGPASTPAQSPAQPFVLRVSIALDGRGHILRDTAIVIENGKITRLDPKAAETSKAVVYDLRAYTVLPGWIDAHTHPSWHFDAAGRLAGQDEPKERTAIAAAANSWKMLAAGFTTVQSLGSPIDKEVRDAIDRFELPGPRIVTSLDPIFGRGEATGSTLRMEPTSSKSSPPAVSAKAASPPFRRNSSTPSAKKARRLAFAPSSMPTAPPSAWPP